MFGKQRTIEKETVFSGKGLQTGRYVNVACSPASARDGIVFYRMDSAEEARINLNELVVSEGPARRTTIGTDGFKVQTVEHFLAALWRFGIDNIRVGLDGPELPALDGSPLGFIRELSKAGVTELDAPKEPIKIREPIEVRENGRYVSARPGGGFGVSYTIDYRTRCVGRQTFDMELDGDTFEREIAPARTFCTAKEALLLRLAGLGRGADFRNTLVLTNKGPIRTEFRFPDEPVRHKVADLVGDLYMLGRPIMGHITAERSGHRLNALLVKEIYRLYSPKERKGE